MALKCSVGKPCGHPKTAATPRGLLRGDARGAQMFPTSAATLPKDPESSGRGWPTGTRACCIRVHRVQAFGGRLRWRPFARAPSLYRGANANRYSSNTLPNEVTSVIAKAKGTLSPGSAPKWLNRRVSRAMPSRVEQVELR
jgi:hypothetical protein